MRDEDRRPVLPHLGRGVDPPPKPGVSRQGPGSSDLFIISKLKKSLIVKLLYVCCKKKEI